MPIITREIALALYNLEIGNLVMMLCEVEEGG